MTPATARLLAAVFVALVVAAFACDTSGDWLANWRPGVEVGLPVGVLAWGSLTAAAWWNGARR